MLKRMPECKRKGDAKAVTLTFEGLPIEAFEGDTVAAAVLSVDPGLTRRTPVSGSPRAPYCMMGVCFDCLMQIDGVANQQACMTLVREGMAVRRQLPPAAAGGNTKDQHGND